MYKIYVGTTNPVKLAAVKSVCSTAEVIGMAVDSGVGPQPLNDEQTIKGAKNRAQQLPKDGLRIGLEAGVAEHDGILFLVNWGVLIDEFDHIIYAGGTRIPLPLSIKNELIKQKSELADIIDAHFHTKNIKHQQGAVGLLTNNYINRKDIFVHIAKLLIGQYTIYSQNQKT